MFKALREKTKQRLSEASERASELKDKAKQRFSDASEKGRKIRENVEVFTGVDKARESFAQAVSPAGASSTAARLGAFSGAALDAEALRQAFAKIGSEPYQLIADDVDVSDAFRRDSTDAGPREDVAAIRRREQGSDAASAEEIVKTLHENFFLPEGDFDPLRHVLEAMSEADRDITVDVLHEQEERLSNQVEAVSTKLAKDVNAHYEDFVQGMRNISELTDGLEQSFVIVKNGRRNIASARESVGRAMRVAESHTRKKSLMAALDMLVRVRECQSLLARICSSLEASRFVDAVVEYAQAMNILKSLNGLTCAATLGQDLRALLWDLMNSVESVLFNVCGDFKPEEYSPLFDAYMQVGNEVKPLGDKVQELFLRSVETQTEGMLRLHAFKTVPRIGIPSVTEVDDDVAARRARMPYKELCQQLLPTQFFPCFQKTLEVLFTLLTSHHRMLRWHEAQVEAMEAKGDDESGNRTRVEAYKAVIGALARSRRAIADMAGARIAALLQASSAPSSGQFKQVLDWAKAFIETTEAFCGTQASTLRGHLERAGDRYFQQLHLQRLEAMREMLESEMWTRLPQAAAEQARSDIRAAARGGRGVSSGFGVAAFDGAAADGSAFEALIAKGNPFTQSLGTSASTDFLTADVDEEGSELNGAGETATATREEDDDEDAAVSAAFIDEDDDDDETLSPEMRRARREARTAVAVADAACRQGDSKGLDARNATLTASSLYMLQGVSEYLRLMRVLTPSMPVIFQGLCSLFETTLVRIFAAFGQHEALHSRSHLITLRLRNTLVRLLNGTSLSTIVNQSSGMGSSAPTMVNSSGNMYGLRERVVALESLSCLAEEFKRLKVGLKQTLPSSEDAKLERFFGQTIVSVEDLREHVYGHVARLLLDLSWIPEVIGDSEKLADALKTGKYAKSNPSTEHNKWVNDLSTELTQFGAKLAIADVTAEALVMLWNYAIAQTASMIVAGFARVKKCSSEGRALMALDVQVLYGNIRHLAPKGSKLEFGFALEYVKAFYIAADKLEYWCMTHAEYSHAQRVALVNQIAGAFGWSSSAKSEFLAKIGSNEMM